MPAEGVLDNQSPNYDEDMLVSHYERKDGWLVLPVMRANAPAKRLRMHGPVGYKAVRFRYVKRGSPPIFPMVAIDTPSGDKFLEGAVTVSRPKLGGNDDQLDYAVAGQYEYMQSSVRGSGDDFETGSKPYETSILDAARLISSQPLAGTLQATYPIDFDDPERKSYASTIPAECQSPSLIV